MSGGERIPVATVLLGVAGMLSLVPATEGNGSLLVAAAVVLVVWSVLERGTTARIPRPIARATDLLVVTSIVAFAVTHFAMETTSLVTLGHVLAVAQLSRAFRKKVPADLMIMNGTAVAQVALASFLTRAAVFLPVLAATVVLGVLASLRIAAMGAPEGRNVRVFTARPRGSAGFRARVGMILEPVGLAVLVFGLGALLFVLLPRGRQFVASLEERRLADPAASAEVRGGGADRRGGRAFTGFSDEVSLGEIGRVKEILREAFRVRITEDRRPLRTESTLYFRGAVYDRFDGRRWHRTLPPPGGERWLTTAEVPAEIPVRRAPPKPGTMLLRQRYVLKETFARALPAVGTVTAIELTEDLPRVLALTGGTFHAPEIPGRGMSYELTGIVSTREHRPAVEDPLGEAERAACLALPPGTIRLSLLAAEVAGQGSSLEKAERLAAWLDENCDYTLSFRPWPSGQPLNDFLFVTRAGHCEYFATALALMLRSVGVPTRLVAGYRGGLWLEATEEYFVRLNDAHAWVEFYFPGRGWLRFDPTPSDAGAVNVPESRVPGMAAEGERADLAEEVAALVNEFGPEERERTFGAAADAIALAFREGFGFGRPPRPYPPPLAAVLGALILTWLSARLYRGLRYGGRRTAGGTGRSHVPAAPPVPFYEEAVRELGRAGIVRRRATSPREFLDLALGVRGDAVRPFRRITSRFESLRYGRRALTPEEERSMREANDELKRRLSGDSGSGGPSV
jgi:transglutaminase-like putative cysteine protease